MMLETIGFFFLQRNSVSSGPISFESTNGLRGNCVSLCEHRRHKKDSNKNQFGLHIKIIDHEFMTKHIFAECVAHKHLLLSFLQSTLFSVKILLSLSYYWIHTQFLSLLCEFFFYVLLWVIFFRNHILHLGCRFYFLADRISKELGKRRGWEKKNRLMIWIVLQLIFPCDFFLLVFYCLSPKARSNQTLPRHFQAHVHKHTVAEREKKKNRTIMESIESFFVKVKGVSQGFLAKTHILKNH